MVEDHPQIVRSPKPTHAQEHCEALFSEIKDKLEGDRPESYHRALLMEAAEALKGADDLTSVYYGYRVWQSAGVFEIRKEPFKQGHDGSYGSFKDGKQHGLCHQYLEAREGGGP